MDEGKLTFMGLVPVAAPLPSLDPLQAAQTVVQKFHSGINVHDYPGSYCQLVIDFSRQADYRRFVEEHSRTLSESVKIDNAMLLSDGTVQVMATIYSTKATGSGQTVIIFHKTYIVKRDENGTWRILSEN